MAIRITTIILLLFSSLSLWGQSVFELIENDGKKSLKVEMPPTIITKLATQSSPKVKDYCRIFVGENHRSDQAQVLGKYAIQDKWVIFTPVFTFQDGL